MKYWKIECWKYKSSLFLFYYFVCVFLFYPPLFQMFLLLPCNKSWMKT
jgi:hypothetical protein